MNEEIFIDKFKEKFGSKKKENEEMKEEKKENDINKNMEGGRVSKLFLRNMYKNTLSDIKEEKTKNEKEKNNNYNKKEKDKDDSLGDLTLSSEDEDKEKLGNKNNNNENKNDNLNLYFSSSKKKNNSNLNTNNEKNQERTSISKQSMLQYIKNLNENEKKNQNQNNKNKNLNDNKINNKNSQNNIIDISNNINKEPRQTVKDILKLNEERIKSLKDERDKYNERNSIYAKNRENWKLKMKKISEFIKNEKEEGQTNEEFFNENEEYLKDFGITNIKDLESIQNIINNINLNDDKIRNSSYLPENPYKNQLKNIKEEFNKTLTKENQSFNYQNDKLKKYNLTNKIVNVLDNNIQNNICYIGKPKNIIFETNHFENNYISKKSKKNKFTDLNTNMQINSDNLFYQQLPKVNKYINENLLKEKFTSIYILKTQNPKLQFRKCESNVEINYSPIKKLNEIQNEISIDIDKTYEKTTANYIIDNENKEINYIGNKGLKKYKSENLTIEKPFYIKLNSNPKIKIYEISHQDNNILGNKNKEYINLSINHEINNIEYNKKPKNKNLVIKKQESQGSINGKAKFINIISNEITDLSYNSEINRLNKLENLKMTNEDTNTIYGTINIQDLQISNDDNQEIKLKANILPNKVTSQKFNILNKEENDNNDINIQSKYQKNIITSLDNIAIMKYEINDSIIPLDPSFLDVLCINCYECIKFEDMDLHSQNCIIELDYFKDNSYDEDYNARIFKLHESLKSKKEEIENKNDKNLIGFYNNLLKIIYQILINNNSIEELDNSITEINKMIKNDINSNNFTQNYKFYFLLFCQRISQLVYMKLKDMEKIMKDKNEISKDSIDSIEIYNNKIEEDDEHIKFMKEQLSSIEDKTIKAKDELKQWKREAKLLENTLKKPNIIKNEQLSDILSDINSKNESIDGLTTFTGQISDFDYDNFNFDDLDNLNDDELKKYFLSVGLGIKFKYSNQIQDNVSISDLFDKAKNQGIKIQNFQEFILKELNIEE